MKTELKIFVLETCEEMGKAESTLPAEDITLSSDSPNVQDDDLMKVLDGIPFTSSDTGDLPITVTIDDVTADVTEIIIVTEGVDYVTVEGIDVSKKTYTTTTSISTKAKSIP